MARGVKWATEEERREARRESLRRYHAKPEVRARIEAHKKRDRKTAKRRAHEHAYTNEWRRRNPEAWAAVQRRRRDRLMNAPCLDPEAADQYDRILRADPCCYCGQREPGRISAIDHIHPLSLGGSADWDNLTAACKGCNSSKKARPLLYFLAVYG